MYWKTALGKILVIKDMDILHLQNCKKLLEKTDIRISTLSVGSDTYSFTEVSAILHEDDYMPSVTYDYTSSPEYSAICLEITYRSQA